MKDLNNSFFRFNNMFGFDEFNQDEKQKENNDEDKSETEEEQKEAKDLNSPAPDISIKQRKIMTDWLDAEYNSAFQYKKVNVKPCPSNIYNNVSNPNTNNDIDIEDPVVIYDFLKKYTNFLYDYNCPKELEKLIIDTLVSELKSYFKLHSTDGLDNHLNTQFIKLKNKYLSSIKNENTTNIPTDKISFNYNNFID